jgi:competence protein ComEC
MAAFLFWGQGERPALLIADNGNLIGVIGPEGRALSRDKGSSFVAGIWLENDGAPVAQDEAAARPGLAQMGRVWHANVGDVQVVQVAGKTALAEMRGCAGADILVSTQVARVVRPCIVYDVESLRAVGAVALMKRAEGLQVITARAVGGVRPWNAASYDPQYVPAFVLPNAQNGPPGPPVLSLNKAQ